jgi:NDP-sugar pyrophosphorylase family protein
MQIIIPMSGFGERFRQAGYTVPKPLIEVDGKPIIEYIVKMFPGETDFIFICNQEHLNIAEYRLEERLNKIYPTGKVIGIESHKLGPVYAVSKVFDLVSLDEPTIVNYCDFTCDWNYQHFKKFIETSKCDGSIPSYRGFHPHTLWSNYYAYVREKDGWIFDIQEKQPFTDVPQQEFASSGTYYFASGLLMRKYFERVMIEKLMVSGEYYASMVYKPMLDDGLKITVYELEHFMQWGVPSDLEEYQYWSRTFQHLSETQERPTQKGSVLLPMVGLGSRFAKEGYKIPKPLIEVSGKPMAVQALNDLPVAEKDVFVLRDDLSGLDELKVALKTASKQANFVTLEQMTDGQASSCMAGMSAVDLDRPLTIAACDNGMIYKSEKFDGLMTDDSIDIIVWGARGYPGAIRNPQMYGWIDANQQGNISNVSVKVPLKNPKNDPIIVGAFTFKRAKDFVEAVKRMKQREGKVNGEYYVDTAINDAIALGLKCQLFEIDYYLCWGTPNDLRTFEYWRSCFQRWDLHSYKSSC